MPRFLALALLIPILHHATAWGSVSKELEAILQRSLEPRFSDLEEMKSSRVIRVLVTYNNTNFFIDQGRERGFECELLKQYERHLNHTIENEDKKIRFVFIPVHFNELIPSLLNGTGDIVAAGLTASSEKSKHVSFTTPYLTDISQVVVSSQFSPALSSLFDLSGKTVYVSQDSSYRKNLERINRALTILRKSPITIRSLNSNFETEDYLELLDAGIIEYTIADQHIANVWAPVLANVNVLNDFQISNSSSIAWAVRKENTELRRDLDRFVSSVKKGTLLGNIFFTRYYEQSERLENPLSRITKLQMRSYQSVFQKYAKMYDFDWLRLAAQGFQETNLNPKAVSRVGAIGIMQLMPSTAYAMGFSNLQDPEENIHAGTHYMYDILNQLSLDENLDPAVKFDFALASYNAGPSRVIKWRKQAKELGLDPNKWFNNVEKIAYQDVGRETVRYVSNINKYYVAYHLATEAAEQKVSALNKTKQDHTLSSTLSNPYLN
ncbi:transporter substrate-binding domain-containing protein [Puniceicoccaceae bacterium K14]|nr:transporter substrate-binding domain-containing protein [Puniceicoccaceae bacterium K14]